MKYAVGVGSCTDGSRLPTLKELLTIVDEDPHLEYDSEKGQNTLRWIDQSAFRGTPAEAFWTSSPRDTSGYWTVDFGDGIPKSGNATGDSRRVRCVRSLP